MTCLELLQSIIKLFSDPVVTNFLDWMDCDSACITQSTTVYADVRPRELTASHGTKFNSVNLQIGLHEPD